MEKGVKNPSEDEIATECNLLDTGCQMTPVKVRNAQKSVADQVSLEGYLEENGDIIGTNTGIDTTSSSFYTQPEDLILSSDIEKNYMKLVHLIFRIKKYTEYLIYIENILRHKCHFVSHLEKKKVNF